MYLGFPVEVRRVLLKTIELLLQIWFGAGDFMHSRWGSKLLVRPAACVEEPHLTMNGAQALHMKSRMLGLVSDASITGK